MPDSQTPTKSQSARFLYGSTKPGRGFLLLYPDRLTAVNSPVDTWGYAIGPVIFLVLSLPLSHRIGLTPPPIGPRSGLRARTI